jgi:hypothetical protein
MLVAAIFFYYPVILCPRPIIGINTKNNIFGLDVLINDVTSDKLPIGSIIRSWCPFGYEPRNITEESRCLANTEWTTAPLDCQGKDKNILLFIFCCETR